jgi:hypothetical protein
MPSSETRALSSIEPQEFTELLRSGRAADLKTLAKRLSEHAACSRKGARRDQAARGVATSKDPRVKK